VRALLFITPWRDPRDTTGPLKKSRREAVIEFRQVLIAENVYANPQNLQEATKGASDFVDFLLEGPHALKGRRGQRRRKPWEE